jgi:Predicted membrane protein
MGLTCGRSSRDGARLAGALLWCLCFQFFVAERIAANAWSVPYDWSRNFISDLGAVDCAERVGDPARYVCSPLNGLMNASFVVQGLLIAAGATLLRGAFPGGRLGGAGLWLVGNSGPSLIAVGLAPEDANARVHFAGAAVHLVCGGLEMVLLGVALLLRRHRPGTVPLSAAGILTAAAGAVGLTGTALLTGNLLGRGAGGMERIGGYPLPLWLTAAGLLLLVSTQRRPDR